MEESIRIRVDARERASGVPDALAAFPDVELEFGTLETADYVLSDIVAVERKTADDFAASILDRRLFGQAAKLSIEFERAVLLLEGGLDSVRSAIRPEALRGALSFLVVVEGLTVLQAGGAEETAALLRVMARHARDGWSYSAGLREPPPKVASVYAEYLVEGLPGVGRRRARDLLTHFGAPAAVMGAAPEELAQVPGIGEKTARRIWDALHTAYDPRA